MKRVGIRKMKTHVWESVCKPTRVLNMQLEAIHTWYQENFVEVLNRPPGREAMSGKEVI
jgi:hypothetical protein